MIHLIIGRQGSGKTLLLVKEAFKYYEAGKNIYSNVHLTFKSKANPQATRFKIKSRNQFRIDHNVFKSFTFKTIEKDEALLTQFNAEYNKYGLKKKELFNKEFGYYKLYLDDIIDCNLKNGLVILDEIHLYLSARYSMSKTSRMMCDSFLSMVRKKGLVVMGTTQTERKVDIRFREEKDYLYMVDKFAYINKEWVKVMHNQDLPKNIPIMIKATVEETYAGSSIDISFIGNEYFNYYDTRQIINIEGLD